MVKNAHFLSAGNAAVADQMAALGDLSAKLNELATLSNRRASSRIAALKARLGEYAAKITLVGQVKAGKSALASVLVGMPGLMPSDVNPWTSVVTTLMVNSRPAGDSNDETKARFSFFDREEWDRLVTNGGRLGELTERAGTTEEMDEVRQQIIAMRQATEKRLGRHFEMLLGQSHSYGYFDTELIERYVCLGDGPEQMTGGAKAGRFADITRSADIYLDIPAYDMPMHLCDTPGVNDTFMMREQITMRSLRGSEICVVVLSAHQALTTSDMALMRLIATLDKRQTIIFVNRVDELADPAAQIAEIHQSILRTLAQNKVDTDVSIIFGSAKWAEAALTGDMSVLSGDSAATLLAHVAANPDWAAMDNEAAAWEASGLPALLQAMGERISDGSAARLYNRLGRSALTLTNEVRATLAAQSDAAVAAAPQDTPIGDPAEALAALAAQAGAAMEGLVKDLTTDLADRLDKAQAGFVKRATDSLIDYMGRHGEQGSWSYDAAGLRALQRAAYTAFGRSMRARSTKIFDEAAAGVQAIYLSVLGDRVDDFTIAAPLAPEVPPPVGIGKTIALDLQSSWWKSWWKRRRSIENSANDYVHLIRAEAKGVNDELLQTQALPLLETLRATLAAFLAEQQASIHHLATDQGADTEPGMVVRSDEQSRTQDEKMTALGKILRDLEARAA